jgi:hypothetical protein
VEQSHRHLQHLLYRFLCCSRAETPQGSQLACAPGDVATRIRSITERHSLCPTPLPTPSSVGLTAFLPPKRERYGLTTFHKVDTNGLGALCPPVALAVHDRVCLRPCTRYSALLAQACQHLWLAGCNDVYREFTCVHHTIHPAPSPPDADRYTLPSRFECQSGDCGYRVRRRCTGRYLPAHLRRILLMEQQVWSLQRARRSTLRPRVAADNQPCDLVSQCFFLTVPFRTRFSPHEMARAAYVQRLRGCLYILWYFYIPPCRFHGTACPETSAVPARHWPSPPCGRRDRQSDVTAGRAPTPASSCAGAHGTRGCGIARVTSCAAKTGSP